MKIIFLTGLALSLPTTATALELGITANPWIENFLSKKAAASMSPMRKHVLQSSVEGTAFLGVSAGSMVAAHVLAQPKIK